MRYIYIACSYYRFAIKKSYNIIGASLSQPHINGSGSPHIDEKYMRDSYIYIYMWYVRHPRAALYKTYRPHEILSDEKSASRKINCGPRGRRRSSKPALHNRPYVVMLSKEQTVI